MLAKMSMTDSPAAKASVLAMIMATHAELEPSELRMLEDLDAFREIGISKTEFLRVADYFRAGPCQDLPTRAWLTLDDGHVVGEVLDRVQDLRSRLLLCRLAQCVIVADGQVDEIERQIYDRMLFQWGYTRSSVWKAILAQQAHLTRRDR